MIQRYVGAGPGARSSWSPKATMFPIFLLIGIGAIFFLTKGKSLSVYPFPAQLGACATCSREIFPAAHSSGTRPLNAITWIVVHDTEGDASGHLGTARNVANYFKNPESGGSTQLIIDNNGGCFRTLNDDTVPWGARGGSDHFPGGEINYKGLHVEMVGLASWTRAEWLTQVQLFHCTASAVAQWCTKYNIPPVFVTGAALKAGQRGITTHRAVTETYHVPGGHLDPGPNFPMDVFLSLVREKMGQSGGNIA